MATQKNKSRTEAEIKLKETEIEKFNSKIAKLGKKW